jgi:hypothetical protein
MAAWTHEPFRCVWANGKGVAGQAPVSATPNTRYPERGARAPLPAQAMKGVDMIGRGNAFRRAVARLSAPRVPMNVICKITHPTEVCGFTDLGFVLGWLRLTWNPCVHVGTRFGLGRESAAPRPPRAVSEASVRLRHARVVVPGVFAELRPGIRGDRPRCGRRVLGWASR